MMRHFNLTLLARALFGAAVVLASTAHAGPGEWTLSGPNGGSLKALQTSPADPTRVYVASQASVFRSSDSGLSWTRVGSSIDFGFINTIAVSPSAAGTIYLTSLDRVWKSTDSGNSWTALSVISAPSMSFSPQDIAIAPSAPDTLYLSAGTAGIYKSINAGAAWNRIGASELPADASFAGIAVDPSNAQRMIVTPCATASPYSGRGYYRSTDGGASFIGADVTGLTGNQSACASMLKFSSTTAGLIIGQGASGFNQLFPTFSLRSTDGGVTLSSFTISGIPGLAPPLITSVHFFSASSWQFGNGTGPMLQTTDAGASFSVAPSPNLPGSTVALESFAHALKPGDASTRYVISGEGFYRSVDSGATWTRHNSGLRATNIRAIALNPSNSTMYAGVSDTAGQSRPFFRSADAGASWTDPSNFTEIDWLRTILLDTNTASGAAQVLYGAGRDNAPNRPPLQRGSPVMKSIDSGNTWTALTNFVGLAAPGSASGIPVSGLSTVRTIAPDRSVVTAGAWSKLYLTSTGQLNCASVGATPTSVIPRIWRTLDAGSTWNTVATAGSATTPGSDGLPLGQCIETQPGSTFAFADYPIPVPLIVDPVDANTIYVGSFLRAFNSASTYVPSVPNGVFRSTDGGVTWTLRSNGLPRYAGSTLSSFAVLALAMDPSNRNILYAATNPFDSAELPGNVYKTIDAGANWSIAGTGLAGQDIRALLIDPSNSLRVYAASGGNALNPGGVFVSENGGATWNSISAGLPVGSATALALRGETLYAGTRFGVAEFTRILDGDGDGSGNATESGAWPNGDGNGDGIPDMSQGNVASGSVNILRNTLGSAFSYTVSSTAAVGCSQLFDVVNVSANSFGLDPLFENKRQGAFRFEINQCAEATVRIRFSAGRIPAGSVIRSYGPSIQGNANSFQWNTLPATVSADGRSITFQLRDNQLGDARADSNRILFQGGPASELLQDGFE
jgi:photosystem II stability/assembly factor-like uncharacterized protein